MIAYETDRLLIRRYIKEDWKDLHEYLSDKEVIEFEPYEAFTLEQAKEEALNEWGARSVIAVCNPLNSYSWKLLERLGMRREGTLLQNIYFKTDQEGNPIWCDTYEYGILKEEWYSL